MRFYQCLKCKKVIGMIQSSACPTMCCGEAMVELVPNTTDAAVEKHVPAVKIEGSKVTVTVGDVIHPMTEEHYIQWIALETKQGAQRKPLAPGAEPTVSFALADGDEAVAVYAFCNLHGLWKKDL